MESDREQAAHGPENHSKRGAPCPLGSSRSRTLRAWPERQAMQPRKGPHARGKKGTVLPTEDSGARGAWRSGRWAPPSGAAPRAHPVAGDSRSGPHARPRPATPLVRSEEPRRRPHWGCSLQASLCSLQASGKSCQITTEKPKNGSLAIVPPRW